MIPTLDEIMEMKKEDGKFQVGKVCKVVSHFEENPTFYKVNDVYEENGTKYIKLQENYYNEAYDEDVQNEYTLEVYGENESEYVKLGGTVTDAVSHKELNLVKCLYACTFCKEEDFEKFYTPSSTNGDYGPSNPWDAPGMSERDFI